MHSKTVLFTALFSYLVICEVCAAADKNIEARGKKKKIAYFVWIADIIIKKFFVLKLIYAFILWAIIHKAGYFLSWFITFLKDKKQEYHHDHHDHHDHHPHYEYGHHYEYGSPQTYGPPSTYGSPQYSNGPYRRGAWSKSSQ